MQSLYLVTIRQDEKYIALYTVPANDKPEAIVALYYYFKDNGRVTLPRILGVELLSKTIAQVHSYPG